MWQIKICLMFNISCYYKVFIYYLTSKQMDQVFLAYA